MPEFATPLTVDADIFTWEPDLMGSRVITGKIAHLHEAASDDVARELRVHWWAGVIQGSVSVPASFNKQDFVDGVPLHTLDGMETVKFSRTQLKRLAVYRLLGGYVWPMLEEHNAEENYARKRAAKWNRDFAAELESLLSNGIQYDWNDDGEAELYQEAYVSRRKSISLTRG